MVQGTQFSPGGGLPPQEVFQRRESQATLIQSVQTGGAGVDTNFVPADPIEPEAPDETGRTSNPEHRQATAGANPGSLTNEAVDIATAAIERRAPDVNVQQSVNELFGTFLEENSNITAEQDPIGATSGFGTGGGRGGTIDLVA